ncbi:MAG TPA: transposase [Polyangiaceae bacterium]|nr:transposase [Polyangiaceae bacterium]
MRSNAGVAGLGERRSEYTQHRPAETTLYQLVAQYLETFLAEARERHERGLPAYVEKEFRAFLKCGIHAFGFLRAVCKLCGQELLVAFSCKRRGACPSCNARRMRGTAAHLVDRVLPEVPVRQWVLSVPFELRLLLARNPSALSTVGRLFVERVLRWQRDCAKRLGIRGAQGGAISFPQRFGGSLNLNVHYHVAIPDGVFTFASQDARGTFQTLPAPDNSDLQDIASDVAIRTLTWLRRRDLLRDERDEVDCTDPRDRSALAVCLEGSLGLGELTVLRERNKAEGDDDDARPVASKAARRGGSDRGFDLHAGVVVSAGDREGRERLLRYCARPPLSLERLRLLPDGRVVYALRKPWGKQTHRVMTPLQFLARLVALVPPPRHPLIRFHGVFAAHARLRARVIPIARAATPAAAPCSKPDSPTSQSSSTHSIPKADPSLVVGRALSTDAADAARAEELISAPDPGARSSLAALQLSLGSRIPWAELLKRVYDVDALACSCGGRLRFIALILESDVARRHLDSLGLESTPPPITRARSPDFADCSPPADW